MFRWIFRQSWSGRAGCISRQFHPDWKMLVPLPRHHERHWRWAGSIARDAGHQLCPTPNVHDKGRQSTIARTAQRAPITDATRLRTQRWHDVAASQFRLPLSELRHRASPALFDAKPRHWGPQAPAVRLDRNKRGAFQTRPLSSSGWFYAGTAVTGAVPHGQAAPGKITTATANQDQAIEDHCASGAIQPRWQSSGRVATEIARLSVVADAERH